MSPDEVLALLGAGRANELIGLRESAQVEFKLVPYRLEEEHQKFELSKDTSALANALGGVVILGVRTERDETHPWDTAVEIRSFPANVINAQQLIAIALAWVYPPIEALDVRIYPDPRLQDHCLAAIIVPPQRTSIGPFLVAKVADAANRIDGALVGYFERRAADAMPLSAQEVQGVLRDGLLFRRALDERAQIPPAEVEPSPARPVRTPKPDALMSEETQRRLIGLAAATKLADGPLFALTATPTPRVDASGMFQAEDHPITQLLRHPPVLRELGFDLNTLQDPVINAGLSRRAMLSLYKGLECWRDGTLLFAATASEEFLSWGERAPNAPLRLNPVPLLESTLLFAILAARLYELAPEPPEYVTYTLTLRRLCVDHKLPLLKPGPADRRIIAEPHEAPDCDYEAAYVASRAEDAGRVAFLLVREVYAWFRLTFDRIPYVREGSVDAAAIQAL